MDPHKQSAGDVLERDFKPRTNHDILIREGLDLLAKAEIQKAIEAWPGIRKEIVDDAEIWTLFDRSSNGPFRGECPTNVQGKFRTPSQYP